MKLLLTIGAGSFIGGILRYALSHFINNKFLSTFPFGTFTVNITGCFLIGLAFAMIEKKDISTEMRLFLTTGLLGGFTTFSAFSIETINLFKEGHTAYAFGYIASSVIIGLLATYIGTLVVKQF